jgi:hypothetical protein
METAMMLSACIATVGIIWEVVEILVAKSELLDKFFTWDVVRSRYYILIRRPLLSAIFDTLLSGNVFISLLILEAAAAVAFPLVLHNWHFLAAFLAAIVLLGHCCIHLRFLVGLDGADQMQSVVWAGLLVYALHLGPISDFAAVIFIAAQLILSYLVAGGAKIISPVWRDGRAIQRITRANTYTPPKLTEVLGNRAVSFAFGWATMLFEIASPALLFWGPGGAIAFIALATLFHIGIALSMGLSTFVFAFAATFPVIYYLIAR